LADLAGLLTDPTGAMTAKARLSPTALATEARDLYCALQTLLSRSLRGMFDGPGHVRLGGDGLGVVLDLSALELASMHRAVPTTSIRSPPGCTTTTSPTPRPSSGCGRAGHRLPSRSGRRPSSNSLGFFLRVEDLDATYERLLAKDVPVITEPRDEPSGRYCVFLDVSGIVGTC
jgi:hypothetical protein